MPCLLAHRGPSPRPPRFRPPLLSPGPVSSPRVLFFSPALFSAARRPPPHGSPVSSGQWYALTRSFLSRAVSLVYFFSVAVWRMFTTYLDALASLFPGGFLRSGLLPRDHSDSRFYIFPPPSLFFFFWVFSSPFFLDHDTQTFFLRDEHGDRGLRLKTVLPALVKRLSPSFLPEERSPPSGPGQDPSPPLRVNTAVGMETYLRRGVLTFPSPAARKDFPSRSEEDFPFYGVERVSDYPFRTSRNSARRSNLS